LSIPYPVPAEFALRKEPSQVRSRRMIEKVLNASLILVAQQGIVSINTNLIAETSGVDIASLYRFFPNKKSILYALCGRSFCETHAVLEVPNRAVQSTDWRAFCHPLVVRLMALEAPRIVYRELSLLWLRGGDFSPLHRWHRNHIVNYVTHQMIRMGSRWSHESLTELAGYLFATLEHIYGSVLHLSPSEQRAPLHWYRLTMDYIIELALATPKAPLQLEHCGSLLLDSR
jgi:AcrR family transcriptional regulator